MNIISGIYHKKNRHIRQGFYNAIGWDVVVLKGKSWNEWHGGNIALAATGDDMTAADCLLYENGIIIAGEIVLYNRQELAEQLDIKIITCTDAALVLAAYKKWDAACVKHLLGEFTFTIWDENKQELFCARDQIGYIPLFYYADDELFLFANRMQILSSFTCCAELDDELIVDFLQINNSYPDRTIFKHVHKLPPGHYIKVTKDKAEVTAYWRLEELPESAIDTVEQAVADLKQQLQKAVSIYVDGHKKTGIELSGGLDSSGVAAFAQPLLQSNGNSLIAFSNALAPADKNRFENFGDEWHKAVVAVEALSIKEHVPIDYMYKDTLQMLDELLDELGYPVNYLMALYQETVYAEAGTRGVDVLLTGFGGNEALTQATRNAYLRTVFRKGNFKPVFQLFQTEGDNKLRAFVKTGYYYGRYLASLEKRNTNKTRKRYWGMMLLADRWLYDKNVRRHFYRYKLPGSNHSLKELTPHYIYNPRTSERAETCRLICSRHHIRYAHPLLYIPLLEYYHTLPDKLKVNKFTRPLFRLAIKDLLPSEIVWQSKLGNVGTAAVPIIQVEYAENFDRQKSWLLSLPENHAIFNYVSRKRLEKMEKNYGDFADCLLKAVLSLAIFMNKEQQRKRYELKESI